MTRHVAIVASSGQLGSDLFEVLSHSGRYRMTRLPHARLDVTNRDEITEVLERGDFDIVVNCAAYNRVDDCEDNSSEAFRINALGAQEVARACRKKKFLCVYISSDFVFNGDKGSSYIEEDATLPVNVYGVSKLTGELLVRQTAERWLIVRTASLYGKYGSRGKSGNFVDTILDRAREGQSIEVVNDIWMSPTYTKDLARGLEALLEADAEGIYHVANSGRCSWYEVACEALRLAGLANPIKPMTANSYPGKARRPKDSSLLCKKFETVTGHRMRPWQNALQDYLVERDR